MDTQAEIAHFGNPALDGHLAANNLGNIEDNAGGVFMQIIPIDEGDCHIGAVGLDVLNDGCHWVVVLDFDDLPPELINRKLPEIQKYLPALLPALLLMQSLHRLPYFPVLPHCESLLVKHNHHREEELVEAAQVDMRREWQIRGVECHILL